MRFASIVGRPIGESRTPPALLAVKSMEQVAKREDELRRKNLKLAATRLLIIFGVLGFGVWAFVGILHDIFPKPPLHFQGAEQPPSLINATAIFTAGVLAITFLIAMFTRKESRSDVADQVLDAGSRCSGSKDNPLVRLYLIVIMIGLLYGEFLLVDAIKATWVRTRLRNVDRRRAAAILAKVFSKPTDIETATLTRAGESPVELRRVLAYLIAYEWLDISMDGLYVRLLSPAQRALRF